MGWFDSFFQGLGELVSGGSQSAGDAMMGGTTDFGPLESGYSAWSPDFSSVADHIDVGGLANSFNDFGGGGIGGANPTQFFDPNTVGPPPVGDALPAAIPTSMPVPTGIGEVAPNQGAALAGSFAGGGEAPSLGDATDPEALLRQGQTTNPWNPSTASPVGSQVLAGPPPTAWESVQQAPGKWWQGVSNDFNKNPIGNSLKIGSTAASIGLPIAAAAMAPSSPRPISHTSTGSMSPLTPAAPLPGTTGTGRADIPAGSPMSPMLTGQGGFAVDPNKGIKKGGK